MNGIYFHQAGSSLKWDLGIQDVADEHPMKKQRVTSCDENNMELVWYRIAGLKERVEKVAAEARDITSALEELLCETRWMNHECHLYIPNSMKAMSLIPIHTEEQTPVNVKVLLSLHAKISPPDSC